MPSASAMQALLADLRREPTDAALFRAITAG
jgi:hypothetical protein